MNRNEDLAQKELAELFEQIKKLMLDDIDTLRESVNKSKSQWLTDNYILNAMRILAYLIQQLIVVNGFLSGGEEFVFKSYEYMKLDAINKYKDTEKKTDQFIKELANLFQNPKERSDC
jgi:hypothetical protein